MTIAAFRLALGTLLSRTLGFVRDALMAAFFSRVETDAWFVAFRLPNFVRRVVAEGALGSVCVPALIGLQRRGETGAARSLVYLLLIIAACGAAVMSLLFYWMAPIWVCFLAPGYCRGPESVQGLTSGLFILMLPYLVSLGLFAVLSAVQQVQGRFGQVGVAAAVWNFTMVLFAAWSGFTGLGDIKLLALAVSLGGALQLIAIMVGLSQSPLWPPRLISLRPQALAPLLREMRGFFPAAFSASTTQLGFLFNTYVASYMESGANSYLAWADRILELPLTLVGLSLGVALVPALTHHFHNKREDLVFEEMALALKRAWLVMVPALFIGVFWSSSIISVLFERGQFGESDRAATSRLVEISILSLPALVTLKVLSSFLIATQKQKLAGWLGLVGLGGQVVFVLSVGYRWGASGLSAGWVVGAYLQLAVTLLAMKSFPYWNSGIVIRVLGRKHLLLIAGLAVLIFSIGKGLDQALNTMRALSHGALLLTSLAMVGIGYFVALMRYEKNLFREKESA